ncbi:hypothetical protein E1A91_A07G080500v1 [Gossypium mustelinum]|uniref:Uncharacterized protein n=1 Tax=Gossypium mustelinum TaxID=34275 RepID=A0A5D2YIP0_GOSMU|nr:hypothetical protein E1A91_A07G080500v1 [Gossypium mustelinum]
MSPWEDQGDGTGAGGGAAMAAGGRGGCMMVSSLSSRIGCITFASSSMKKTKPIGLANVK